MTTHQFADILALFEKHLRHLAGKADGDATYEVYNRLADMFEETVYTLKDNPNM